MWDRLSTVIMCHPSRRGSAERIAAAVRPLAARIVEDPDPAGCPSPLRTAKLAWAAVAGGATHHLVLQDDVELCDGFAAQVATLTRRHPGAALALSVLWNSPYNAYRVRQAAVAGHPAVRLAGWEWVPALGLVLPAGAAVRLADYLRGFPDEDRDDDEHIAVFCARHGIDVITPVPHLLDHRPGPSVAGNDDHGLRRAAVPATGPAAAGTWDGPVLAEAGRAGGVQYGVELVESACYLRLRRSGGGEATESPFTWPWRPWSALLGVPAEVLAAGPVDPPPPLAGELAAEIWAAGFLLGALAPPSAPDRPAHRAPRTAAADQALRSWIAAGLRPSDQERLGAAGREAAAAHLRRAVAAGRRYRPAGVTDRESPGPGRPLDRLVERMAVREARTLLQYAPAELPEIGLVVRRCGAHPVPARGPVAGSLPARWLGQRIRPATAASAVVLAALGCEVLEPRGLTGLATLAGGGWTGTVETRAATAARLRGQGRDWRAVLVEIDRAEARFEAGGTGPVTLPAWCRAAAGHWFVSPHAPAGVERWSGPYQQRRLRAVLEVGL